MSFFVKMAGLLLVVLAMVVTLPRIVNPSLFSRSSTVQYETPAYYSPDVKGSGVVLVPDAAAKKSSKAEASILFYVGGGLIVFAIWGKRKLNNK